MNLNRVINKGKRNKIADDSSQKTLQSLVNIPDYDVKYND